MDFGIPAIATSMANMETSQELNIGMMRRAIDQTAMVGEQLMQMMESMTAQMTGAGNNINITA
ncbi:MAG: YjfB family protein [Defluviitaleaceae bacterium]|nr:YjfB family protein [Defluviitaleaceae bacterium]